MTSYVWDFGDISGILRDLRKFCRNLRYLRDFATLARIGMILSVGGGGGGPNPKFPFEP